MDLLHQGLTRLGVFFLARGLIWSIWQLELRGHDVYEFLAFVFWQVRDRKRVHGIREKEDLEAAAADTLELRACRQYGAIGAHGGIIDIRLTLLHPPDVFR